MGCFWHVQHEFVDAERSLLGRGDDQLTALAGYAGGKQTGKDTNRPGNKEGIVCYHNLQGVADYGKLGYGEVTPPPPPLLLLLLLLLLSIELSLSFGLTS